MELEPYMSQYSKRGKMHLSSLRVSAMQISTQWRVLCPKGVKGVINSNRNGKWKLSIGCLMLSKQIGMALRVKVKPSTWMLMLVIAKNQMMLILIWKNKQGKLHWFIDTFKLKTLSREVPRPCQWLLLLWRWCKDARRMLVKSKHWMWSLIIQSDVIHKVKGPMS